VGSHGLHQESPTAARGDVATAFLERVVDHARRRGLLSGEHFTVDGTLLEVWASLKSFKRTDAGAPPPDDPGNPPVDFHGERRSNDTHGSTTDPEAGLARKGNEAVVRRARDDRQPPRLGR